MDAGRVVRARAHRRPRLHIAAREREHAGRAGGAAGLVDALDLVGSDAQVAAERRLLVERLPQLGLGRKRKLVQVGKAYERVADPGLAKLARVKRR